ncbi:MAG: thiamine phosphate synthase [Acidobacteria bacterium]|nr:MAG: thiamine phosphate synthase [Acidobacteriota bacterium]
MRVSFLDPVYPLTHCPNSSGASHAELASSFLRGGSRFFQVRAKDLPDRRIYEELQEIAAACGRHQARFVVNDRPDLALAGAAAGVHLGQNDLPVAVARRLLGTSAIIGVSTHDEQQFVAALGEDVAYVAVGPIFESPTKPGINRPIGCEALARLTSMTELPVVAIGGITLRNVTEVWEAGAASAAIISDIVGSADPAARIRQYLELAANRFPPIADKLTDRETDRK